RHAPQFVLRDVVLANQASKLPASFDVGHGFFKRCLAEAKCSPTSLQAAVRKATHLQIKASMAPLLLANEAVSRQKKLIVEHREGMHTPVARGSISLGA